MRVVQGFEPAHFLRIFKGKLNDIQYCINCEYVRQFNLDDNWRMGDKPYFTNSVHVVRGDERVVGTFFLFQQPRLIHQNPDRAGGLYRVASHLHKTIC